MRQRLIPHPAMADPPAITIMTEIARYPAGVLRLRYRLDGIEGLTLPSLAASERTDELWRRTCFEAFVQPVSGEAYYEINLSPSTRWAAYRFDRYREGMADAALPAPRLEVRRLKDALELDATVELPDAQDWRVGLSAVIETTGGAISYWALAHPPERADFHRADCFALQIPAPQHS